MEQVWWMLDSWLRGDGGQTGGEGQERKERRQRRIVKEAKQEVMMRRVFKDVLIRHLKKDNSRDEMDFVEVSRIGRSAVDAEIDLD